MKHRLTITLVVIFALVSWVACGGGTGESTGTGPESQDARDSDSGGKIVDRIEGWKTIAFRTGDDAYPVVELQVPENWPFVVAKSTFASLFDENMEVTFVRTGRRALEGSEEAFKDIPKEKLSLLNIYGLYGNVLTPDGEIQMKYRPLDHFEIKGREYLEEYEVSGIPFSVDGIGATQYRRESTLEGGNKTVRLDTIISSDNPRTFCGAFGFHIFGSTSLGNEAILHKVIDTIKVSDPKMPIFKSCEDPAGDYSAWVDSFQPVETPTPTVLKPLHTDNEVIDLVRNHMKYTWVPGDACSNLEYLAQQWEVTDLDSKGKYLVSAISAGIDLRWEVSMSSRDVRPTGNNQVQTYYDC